MERALQLCGDGMTQGRNNVLLFAILFKLFHVAALRQLGKALGKIKTTHVAMLMHHLGDHRFIQRIPKLIQ